jgi:hypothetical protein
VTKQDGVLGRRSAVSSAPLCPVVPCRTYGDPNAVSDANPRHPRLALDGQSLSSAARVAAVAATLALAPWRVVAGARERAHLDDGVDHVDRRLALCVGVGLLGALLLGELGSAHPLEACPQLLEEGLPVTLVGRQLVDVLEGQEQPRREPAQSHRVLPVVNGDLVHPHEQLERLEALGGVHRLHLGAGQHGLDDGNDHVDAVRLDGLDVPLAPKALLALGTTLGAHLEELLSGLAVAQSEAYQFGLRV